VCGGIEVAAERVGLSERLFALACFPQPGLAHLAPSKMWWKAATLVAVVAAMSPATLGRRAWETHGTVAVLLQMLVTGNFRFPPVAGAGEGWCSAAGGADRAAMLRSESEAAESDGAAAAQAKAWVAHALPQQAQELQKMLDAARLVSPEVGVLAAPAADTAPAAPAAAVRCPPSEELARLEELDQTLQLGAAVRAWRDPDALVQTIKADSASVAWLPPILAKAPQVLTPPAPPPTLPCALRALSAWRWRRGGGCGVSRVARGADGGRAAALDALPAPLRHAARRGGRGQRWRGRGRGERHSAAGGAAG